MDKPDVWFIIWMALCYMAGALLGLWPGLMFFVGGAVVVAFVVNRYGQ